MVSKGHIVTICSVGKYGIGELPFNTEVIKENVILYKFSVLSKKLSFISLTLSPKFLQFLKNYIEQFDIVHINEYRTIQAILVSKLCINHNVPYVLQPRGSFQKTNKYIQKNIFDFLFGNKIITNASKIIISSKNEYKLAKQFLEKIYISESRITFIPNGINSEVYIKNLSGNEFRNKYMIDNSTKLILYLGRIHEVKGLDLLVKSFNDLLSKRNDVKLMIIGPDSGYKTKLKSIISEFGINDYVFFIDGLFDDEKLCAYSAADVFVLPSKEIESFGNVALESIACGTPTVVTNVCGISEWIDNIIVVDPDPNSLKNGIIKALDDEGKKLASLAQIESKNLDWKKISDILFLLYKEVIDNNKD